MGIILCMGTRSGPEIALATSMHSWQVYMLCFKQQSAAIRLIKWLNLTHHHVLFKTKVITEVFSSWEPEMSSRAWCWKMIKQCAVVHCRSKLKNYVMLGCIELEKVEISQSGKVVAWIRQVLHKTGTPQRSAAVLQYNTSTMRQNGDHPNEDFEGSKHIEV